MKQFRLFLILTALLVLVSSAAQAAEVAWRLDAEPDDGGLRSWRTSLSAYREAAEVPTRDGLDTLYVSASAQYSEAGMDTLVSRLQEITDLPVYVVDLRQESHGFVDGAAVSLHGSRNQLNAGMDAVAVEADETERLAALVGTDFFAAPMGYADTALMSGFSAAVERAVTEREAAAQRGLGYVRIAATDQVWPEPQAVDAFVSFYRSLPESPVWLHFHCQAGHGRTTTFMVLYDMLRNPELDADTAAWRQYLLGGSNLLLVPSEGDAKDWRVAAARERLDGLRLFHDYAAEQQPQGFTVSWSEWLASRESE